MLQGPVSVGFFFAFDELEETDELIVLEIRGASHLFLGLTPLSSRQMVALEKS